MKMRDTLSGKKEFQKQKKLKGHRSDKIFSRKFYNRCGGVVGIVGVVDDVGVVGVVGIVARFWQVLCLFGKKLRKFSSLALLLLPGFGDNVENLELPHDTDLASNIGAFRSVRKGAEGKHPCIAENIKPDYKNCTHFLKVFKWLTLQLVNISHLITL